MAASRYNDVKDEKRKRIPTWNAESELAAYVKAKGARSRLSTAMYLVFRSDLRAVELRLALYLCLKCDFEKRTPLSGTQLARAIGSSNPNHVLRAVKRLAALGIIDRCEEHPKKCTYRLEPVFGSGDSLVSLVKETSRSRASENSKKMARPVLKAARSKGRREVRDRADKVSGRSPEWMVDLDDERWEISEEDEEEARKSMQELGIAESQYEEGAEDNFDDDE